MPYSKVAVDKAIQASNRAGQRIGRREADAIHRLLKGPAPVMDQRLIRERLAHVAHLMADIGERDMGHVPYALAHKFHKASDLVNQVLAFLEKETT